MNVIIKIKEREAVPVRAIPYVCNFEFMAGPHSVAVACAKPMETRVGGYTVKNREAMTAHLMDGDSYRTMAPREWNAIVDAIVCLEKRKKADERVEDENLDDWREGALLKLPAGVFVWLDELQRWFSHMRPLNEQATPASSEDEEPFFEQETDELIVTPYIPADIQVAIREGFAPESAAEPGKLEVKKDTIRAILAAIKELDSEFSPETMPGQKADFFALCREHDPGKIFKTVTQSTFNGYLKGLCKFGRGARPTDYYREISPRIG